MNNTQDMILYFQAQTLAKLQSASSKKPTPPKTEDRESFQDLLSQKGQESTEKPQAPESAEKPQRPAEQPQSPTEEVPEDGGLDPYRQQMLAAAQVAAMALPIQSVEATPQALESQAVPTIQPVQPDQSVLSADLPKLEPQGTVGQEATKATVTEVQTPIDVPAQTQKEPLTQTQSAVLSQAAPKTESKQTAQTLPEQTQKPATTESAAIVQTPKTQTAGDDVQPELQSRSEQGKETVVTTAQAAPEQALFRQVESTPIKVGDAPVVDTDAPDVDVQLAKQVDTLLAKGGDKVELRLSPGHLGTVTVELTRSQDGSIHVALSASGEKALGILEKHAAGLESALLNANRAPVQVEVQRGQESQQSQNQQQTYDREGRGQQQQEQQRQPNRDNSQDFLQQLRLGLFPAEGEAS